MGQNEVINLPDVPSRDHSAMSKNYVADNFCDTSGDTMTGNLNLGGHETMRQSPIYDKKVNIFLFLMLTTQ